MKFCPKCGSIMKPEKQGITVLFKCSCGHAESGESKIKEVVKHETKDIRVAEEKDDIRPIVNTKCPKCGNGEAYNWEIQTRAGDEPATQFFKCRKCSHTWREYK